MPAPDTEGDGGAVAPPDPWDPLVRLSHWTLAVAVIVNGLLSKPGGALHVTIGWVALAVLSLRLFWGFVGPRPARFSAFPPAPRAAMAHLGGLLRRGTPRAYASHNPAGALMVYALWACLGLVIATGLVATGGQTPTSAWRDRAAVAEGDWSALVTEGAETESDGEKSVKHAAEEVHVVAANLMLALVLLHVAGVAAESWALRRNLVRPMIRGPGRTG